MSNVYQRAKYDSQQAVSPHDLRSLSERLSKTMPIEQGEL